MTRTQLYSLPRIVDYAGDLAKRWHVVFYHQHPHTGQMQRLRIYADLARYSSKRHRKLLQKLGYGPEYTLYGWKHSGVIAAYLAGLDVLAIQQMCGHSSVDMTYTYLRNIGLVRSGQAKTGVWSGEQVIA